MDTIPSVVGIVDIMLSCIQSIAYTAQGKRANNIVRQGIRDECRIAITNEARKRESNAQIIGLFHIYRSHPVNGIFNPILWKLPRTL